MSQSAVETKKARGPLNGVDTPTLFATIDVVRNNPPLAKFQFRATNRWVSGTHGRGANRASRAWPARPSPGPGPRPGPSCSATGGASPPTDTGGTTHPG